MKEIHILTKETIAKIAAGEVVERPASVVKELIENSIDAKSTNITVNIKDSGKSLIEIIDNGKGMHREDAEIALEQHTTSKIESDKDLENIITLGFRGEALSSISAVSEIEIETSREDEGTKVTNEGNSIKILNISRPQGTTIKVKNLFRDVPARRKFLRTDSTEFKHISDIFIQHALANPNIHFKLSHNNREIFNLPSTPDLKVRLYDIWGKKHTNVSEIYFDGPKLKIEGLIGHPEIARKDRNMQFLFLNSRPIKSDLISKAVQDAYHSTLHEGRYPIYFINLLLDPKEVDVNVHPRKQEVKFTDTRSLFSNVKHAVEKALEKQLQKGVEHHFDKESPTYTPKVKERQASYRTQPKSQSLTSEISNYRPKVSPNHIQASMSFSKQLISEEDIPIKNTGEGNNNREAFLNDFNAIQFFDTYILIQRDNKILFIDQHAADERIKYEEIMKKVKNSLKVDRQPLLITETVELSNASSDLVKENIENFSRIGLEIEPFGKDTFKIAAIPSILTNFNFKEFIDEIIEREITDFDAQEVLHKIVASMACHGSIRAGKKLNRSEIIKMISQLFKCEKPYSCPHGRPIIWDISREEIEKRFKRTGFC